MDEPTSLKFVNRRIGELTKKYAAPQTADARTSAIVEELSQLSIVRDELKKTQRKIYTAVHPTDRPKIETLLREMDKLARQMTETRRENRDRSEIVNEITRLSFLADSLSKSKNSQWLSTDRFPAQTNLILLDLHLPDMNRAVAARAIETNTSSAHLASVGAKKHCAPAWSLTWKNHFQRQ
jgi:CheY-like chemotaxis protein